MSADQGDWVRDCHKCISEIRRTIDDGDDAAGARGESGSGGWQLRPFWASGEWMVFEDGLEAAAQAACDLKLCAREAGRPRLALAFESLATDIREVRFEKGEYVVGVSGERLAAGGSLDEGFRVASMAERQAKPAP